MNPLSKEILWIVEHVTVINKNIQMAGRCVSTCIQQILSVCCVVDSLQDAGELITGLGCFTWNCFIYKIKAVYGLKARRTI